MLLRLCGVRSPLGTWSTSSFLFLPPVPSIRLLQSAWQHTAPKCPPQFYILCPRGETVLGEMPWSQRGSLCHSASRWLWSQRGGFSETPAQLFLVRNFGVSQSLFQHQPTKILIFIITTPRELICYMTLCVGFLMSPKEWTRWQLWSVGDSRSGIWFWYGGKRKWDGS